MTTIAYKNGVIVCDGRSSLDYGLVVDDRSIKAHLAGGHVLFLTGSMSEIQKMVEEIRSNPGAKELSKSYNCHGMAVPVSNDRLGDTVNHFYVDKDSNEINIYQLSTDTHFAVGGGDHFAISAMDFGKTAWESVEYASTRDCYTSSPLYQYRLGEPLHMCKILNI